MALVKATIIKQIEVKEGVGVSVQEEIHTSFASFSFHGKKSIHVVSNPLLLSLGAFTLLDIVGASSEVTNNSFLSHLLELSESSVRCTKLIL